jgi:hypothetical protein
MSVSERAEAMLAKITPGPWELTPPDPAGFPGDYWSIGTRADGLLERVNVSCPNPHAHPGLATAEADARFIAAAPQLVRDLLAEVRRQPFDEIARDAARDGGRVYVDDLVLIGRDALDRIERDRGEQTIRADALQAKIDEVRSLHHKVQGCDDWDCCAFCVECGEVGTGYPCATIEILGER